jgi:hypothetical protein
MKLSCMRSHPRAGSVLVLSLLLVMALGGLAATLSVLNLRLNREHERASEDLRAFCVAEAGLNEAYSVLTEHSIAGVEALAYPKVSGPGSYRVDILDGRDDHAIDVDSIRLRAVGESGGEAAGVMLMVHHVPTGSYRYALFGAEGVHLNSNVMIDSYDPSDGPYPDDVDYVNDFGNVGSYEEIEIDANTDVYGDVQVAEGGLIDDGPPGIVIAGDVESTVLDVVMPPIVVPPIASTGAITVNSTLTLGPGNHHYTNLNVSSGTLNIVGPATLVLDSFTLRSNANLHIDSTNGPVKIYGLGNFDLRSNSNVTTTGTTARDLDIQLTASSPPATIKFNSNTDFMGTIYAPNANLVISSNFTVYGAVMAKSIEMASNSQVHFDESLLYDPDAADVFERVAWRRLSRAEIREILEAAPLP